MNGKCLTRYSFIMIRVYRQVHTHETLQILHGGKTSVGEFGHKTSQNSVLISDTKGFGIQFLACIYLLKIHFQMSVT